MATSVDRVSVATCRPIQVPGDDELARLADSHNRLAADLERRNRELGRILAAIDEVSPRDNVDALVDRTASDAATAFALIDATVVMGHPSMVEEEVVPGVASLSAPCCAPAARTSACSSASARDAPLGRADQDLLELFASEMAAAIRNAQLFATVESQNQQLIELGRQGRLPAPGSATTCRRR